MFSLSNTQLIGYQTQPISLRQTPGGTSVTDLNIVVPVRIQKEDGEWIDSKSFHTVTLWAKKAEIAAQFLRPGGQVFVGGRLQTDSWDDEQSGEKKSKTKIVAHTMILLDPKDGQTAPPDQAKQTLGNLNRTDIIGNITQDPEVRTTTSGQKVVSISVATNEQWTDKTSGEKRERAEFHRVVLWRELAEEAGNVIRKGQRVHVAGRLQTRSFETQSGSKRSVTEIVASECNLLGVSNAVASESVRADASAPSVPAPSREDTPKDVSQESEVATANIPDIKYESEVKVEDLPF